MIKIYGIKNCDSVKKAFKALEGKSLTYEFIDFKKTPPDLDLIKKWLKQIDVDVLINKRGTTWRKLPDEVKENLDEDTAISIMRDNPSVIKRPVNDNDGEISVGLNCQLYIM